MGNIIFTDIGKSVKISFGDKKGDYGFMELEIPKSSTPLIVEEDNIHLSFYSNGDKIVINFNDIDTPTDSINASDLRDKLSDLFFKESLIFDADALIYFNAVIANGSALSILEQAAYNAYRISSKENADPWNGDTHLDYPMLGSTAESMVINAQNPGTFDAIAVNTVTSEFTANGYKGNGTNSYFDTNLVLDDIGLSDNSLSIEYYSRTTNNTSSIFCGSVSGVSNYLFIRSGDGAGQFNIRQPTSDLVLQTTSNGFGYFMMVRRSAVDLSGYINGVFKKKISTSVTSGYSNNKLYLQCYNNLGMAQLFTNQQNAGFGVFDALSANQVTSQYNARSSMNAIFNR